MPLPNYANAFGRSYACFPIIFMVDGDSKIERWLGESWTEIVGSHAYQTWRSTRTDLLHSEKCMEAIRRCIDSTTKPLPRQTPVVSRQYEPFCRVGSTPMSLGGLVAAPPRLYFLRFWM
jgi:hypothetical protein